MSLDSSLLSATTSRGEVVFEAVKVPLAVFRQCGAESWCSSSIDDTRQMQHGLHVHHEEVALGQCGMLAYARGKPGA